MYNAEKTLKQIGTFGNMKIKKPKVHFIKKNIFDRKGM